MHIDMEVAETLAEQYNSFAMQSEEFEPFEADWILEHLLLTFDAEDVASLMEDDFGRGIIMGQLHTLKLMEAVSAEEEES